jgi:oligoendopeptidase F
MDITEISTEKKRKYIPADFKISDWKSLQPFYEELKNRKIGSAADLEKLIANISELDAVVSEDAGWRYIRMTCDTANEKLVNDYTFFISEIYPKVAPFANDLNKKVADSSFTGQLDKEKYFIYLRGLKNQIELFREENIPLNTEIKNEEQKYGALSAEQTIEHDGKEITLQQAGVYLKSNNREIRKEVYMKIQERRSRDEEKLNELYDKLIVLRDKVALNAGFKNFRDYMHRDLGRFDYTVNDCFAFHEAVKNHIVPLCTEMERARKEKLKYDSYRPWDTEFDVEGKEPLHPFKDGEDLTRKTIDCFYKIEPFFGQCIELMKKMGHLDLESRKGKAPGGYNYPLYETGVPFIFMNSAGLHRDVVTMVHEGGHALHSILTRDLPLTENKSVPSEVAELASMSMELISMENWEAFFENSEDLLRAKKEQLEKTIKALPWIAAIDKFQHWIYLNPGHTVEERYDCWVNIMKEFGTGVVDYSGLEKFLRRGWQVQLHLFEVPFYYIEYGFAQLGAIAMWRNYKTDHASALEHYQDFLKLGYTKTIPEIYTTAGIKFDFSDAYIKELADFIRGEYHKL